MKPVRSIAVLGSTGSVGRNALQVAADHPDRFRVLALAAGSNWKLLADQVKAFRPRYCALADRDALERLRGEVRHLSTEIIDGSEGVDAILEDPEIDAVLLSVVGAAGLPAAHAALQRRKHLAVANKESLVMAGELLCRLARENGLSILPVDSEHSAVFQAIRTGSHAEIRRVILTASGGPFRRTPREDLANVTPEAALRHPVWKMGPKITIDSATMMNKALEIVEAKWLFGLRADQIEVAVHPQSLVHSMVEFHDGAVVAQMGVPDMKVPIQYALSFPERLPRPERGFRFGDFASLTFERPDVEKFPAIRLGYLAAEQGGTMGAVLNGANETAVRRFLEGRIRFPRIAAVVEEVMSRHDCRSVGSIEDVFEADRWSRDEASRIS
jgi:1-deoxy-D-xylulose-5-phosphate reductoisomerase